MKEKETQERTLYKGENSKFFLNIIKALFFSNLVIYNIIFHSSPSNIKIFLTIFSRANFRVKQKSFPS